MISLIQETLQRSTYGAPALPVSELVRELRSRGAAVTDTALRRASQARGSGLRVVECPEAPSPAGAPRSECSATVSWVVLLRPEEWESREGALPCLRRTLADLTARLDERSSTDLARWRGLMEEARQLPRAA